jgi:biopolymer transport protein ExbD
MPNATRTVGGVEAWQLLLAAGLALGVGPCDGCFGRGTPAPPPAPPVSTEQAQEEAARTGIKLQLVHDASTGVTTYQVDESPPGDAAALATTLASAEAKWTRTHRTRPSLTIEAKQDVPWKDIIAAVDACKAAGLTKVEFAFEGRPH